MFHRLPFSLHLGIAHLALLAFLSGASTLRAQPPSTSAEHFIPADQLNVVFDQSAGVLLPSDEYRKLVNAATAAERSQSASPAGMLIRSAAYHVSQTSNHALITVTLDIEQFTNSWQHVDIPAGNLQLEQASINETPAVIGRESSSLLRLFHRQVGRFQAVLSFSTPLGRIGSDRAVGFDLVRSAPVMLKVDCLPDQHLLLNGRQLQRPQPQNQAATHELPAGLQDKVSLLWTSSQSDTTTETLVFAHSDVQTQLSVDTLRWTAQTRLSVFGGPINRLTASVPSSLEITAVESTGLESWDLSDDPDRDDRTLVKLTWRQPFDADRLISISGVSAVDADRNNAVPTLIFNESTAHTGHLILSHEHQLRLMATTGNGIRQLIPVDQQAMAADSPVFDFWLQEFELAVELRPRDRELFSQTTSILRVTDTKASFQADVSIETLNAPLFETQMEIPAEWHLVSVTKSDGTALHWRADDGGASIKVEPQTPVGPGNVLPIRVMLERTIADPATPQQIGLPVVRVTDAAALAGHYTIASAPDLKVAPTEIAGLVPRGEQSGNIVFDSQGTPVSGTITITRRPVRLSSRTEIRCWMDTHHSTATALISVDVLNGTTRKLQIALPESTGSDLHFDVVGITAVPGYESASMSRLVPSRIHIAEVTSDEPVDGVRLWNLTFDRRFSGTVTVSTRVQQAREGNLLNAPTINIPGAIHQEGLVTFEAAPDQQFEESPDQPVSGLREADPSLVTPPTESSGRRVARVFQFVQPVFRATLAESRYETQTVPTAVCRTMRNTSVLSDTGSVQRSCRVMLHCVGVQTLRFTLPRAEESFLWATALNGEPVEVRRDEDDYLVAIPTDQQRTDHVLELLFESNTADTFALTGSAQDAVELAIDTDSNEAARIDVLEQTWQVHYPPETLLLDHAGSFHALGSLARPGWLQSILRDVSVPSASVLTRKGLIAGGMFVGLFIATVLILRQRWMVLGALVLVAAAIGLFVLESPDGSPTGEQAKEPVRNAEPEEAPATYDVDGIMPLEDSIGVAIELKGGSAGREESDMAVPGAPTEQLFGGELAEEAAVDEKMINPSAGLPIFDQRALGQTSTEFEAFSGRAPQDDQGGQASADGDELDRISESTGRGVPLKGAARLSVRVNLAQPHGYQSAEFRSVGAAATSGQLSVVMRTTGQIATLRLLAAAFVLCACWLLRHRSVNIRLTAVGALGLLALAAVPVAPNQWQSVLDGMVIGSVLALLLWPVTALLNAIQNFPWRGRTVSTIGLLLLTASGALADDKAGPLVPAVETPPPTSVVRPYTPGEPPLTADKVFISRDEFLRLYRLANPGQLKPGTSPTKALVAAAFYHSGARQQVQQSQWTQEFTGRLVIHSFQDQPVLVSLPLRDVGLRSAMLNEEEAVVVRNDGQLQVRVPSAGLHLLDVVFDVAATIDESGGMVALRTDDIPAGMLTFELPADNLATRVNGSTTRFRTEGTTLRIPLAGSDDLRIEWQPAANRVSSDTIVHANFNSTFDINDQGLEIVAVGTLNCRQGSLSDAELILPKGYSVRSVTGKDIAGWSVEKTQEQPRLKVLFRSEISSETSLQVELFARQIVTTDRQSLAVPILEPVGASRSTGIVSVFAGTELDVRTESLSGVSQINPGDAALPAGVSRNDRPILAWRFNRHPASIVVRATRVAARLTTQQLHGVQLESERQLWTSSFDVNIQGAPRRRLDIRIPATFLAFEVDCTDLADWYVSDNDDNSEFRTLSVLLTGARTGRIRVVVQGQNQRSEDRTVPILTAPRLMDVDDTQTQLSVWLESGTEIAGFDGQSWSDIAARQITQELRNLRPGTPPAISFATTDTATHPVTLKLRSVVPSVLCESVTVTNVTDTSIERTLALSWHIAQSSADTFSVELPARAADTLDFRVPGLRQEQRTALDEDRVRITFHLQYPVSDRFFAAGTGAIPLPKSGHFRSIPTRFVASDARQRDISITGQAHYWVVVNQSAGVLEAARPEEQANEISAAQLQTNIPEGFLSQSVAIRQVTGEPTDGVWQIVFPPEQQTSPAVISLAQHVTVLADDGTWRSRHTLQVRNESRQFLPVLLPEGSRPLFCMVNGRPTRIVVRPQENEILHLIPVPQSGIVSAPVEVQFAIAGSLPDEARSFRKRWQQQSVQVPAPTFPDYRDDKELGVTITRNTWTVYVPETWSSTAADDPRLTNVRYADTSSLNDAVILSSVDNTRELLEQARQTKISSTRNALQKELSLQLRQLRQQKGTDNQAEADRVQALQDVEIYINNNAIDGPSVQSGNSFGVNRYLHEQALNRNGFSNLNNMAIIQGNSLQGNADMDNNIRSQQELQIFNFEIPESERRRQEQLSTNSKLSPRQRQSGQRRRSQLLDNTISVNGRDGVRLDLSNISGAELSSPFSAPPVAAGSGPGSGHITPSPAPQSSSASPAQTTPVSAGLLSLQFEIPTDGERLDFVRPGGNATLTLNVRSSQAGDWLRGGLWGLCCLFIFVLMLRCLSSSDVQKTLLSVGLILSLSGLIGWLFLPVSSGSLALVVSIFGAGFLCAAEFKRTQIQSV